MVRLFLGLFLASQALGATIKLPSNVYPVGLAAAADGTLWYVGAFAEAGRVLPSGEVERLQLPVPFYVERSAGIVVLGDGTVLIGSATGVIARVDRQMNASLIDLGDRYTEVEDMVIGPDGAAWFIANTYFRHSVFGRVESGGAITTFPLPNRVSAMTVGPDGSFVIVGSQQILRVTSKGAVEVIADCSQCWSDWVAVTADGTIWLAPGRFEPGKGFVPRRFDGRASTIGPDGKVWIAADTNAVRALNADGTFREIPFAHPDQIPLSILSVGGVIWYGLAGALRSFDPGTPVDLHLGLGDIVAIEMEQNRYFEGEHQVLAFHRRGGEPFVRRIQRSNGEEHEGSGIYALSASRILFDESDHWPDRDDVALLFDGEGVPRGSIAGAPNTRGHGVVVDRNGTIHALRSTVAESPAERALYRLMTIDAGGAMLRDIPIPIRAESVIGGIDLSSDQCTLLYTAIGPEKYVGRLNICNGAVLSDFAANLPERPMDLRILPDQDVLVVFPSRLVRYDAAGNVVVQFDAPPLQALTSVALDPDPQYIWLGAPRELWRVTLATGKVVERLPAYGFATHISVIGEPRAARLPGRRRASRS